MTITGFKPRLLRGKTYLCLFAGLKVPAHPPSPPVRSHSASEKLTFKISLAKSYKTSLSNSFSDFGIKNTDSNDPFFPFEMKVSREKMMSASVNLSIGIRECFKSPNHRIRPLTTYPLNGRTP